MTGIIFASGFVFGVCLTVGAIAALCPRVKKAGGRK